MKKIFSLFAAVLFAGSMMAAVEEFTVTINTDDFNSTSYAANNGNHTSTAYNADSTKSMTVDWTSNQMMLNTGKIQGQKNNAYLYNAAAWGTIKSVTINDNENYSYVIGSTAQPTETATGGFFKIKAGGSTSKASSFVIVFDADADSPVLKANDIALGTVIFEGESTEVVRELAVEASNLTEDIAVSTTSSKLSFNKNSVDKDGGSVIVTITSGQAEVDETITLTSGTNIVNVKVTGSFWVKVKNPGTAATFEAGPANAQGGDSTFVNGDKAVKVGTSNNAGTAIITVPAKANKLHFMAAAWANKACTMTLSAEGITLGETSFDLTADAGITGNSPFNTAEGDWTNYQYTVTLSGVTAETEITATATGTNKRFVIWDVTYELETATAIDNAEAEVKAIKRFENGVLIIEKNGVKYNAQGAVVR